MCPITEGVKGVSMNLVTHYLQDFYIINKKKTLMKNLLPPSYHCPAHPLPTTVLPSLSHDSFTHPLSLMCCSLSTTTVVPLSHSLSSQPLSSQNTTRTPTLERESQPYLVVMSTAGASRNWLARCFALSAATCQQGG